MSHQVRLTKTWMQAPFKGRNLPMVKGSNSLDFKGQCLICLNDGWKKMFLLKWSLFMRHVNFHGVVGLSTHFGASGNKSSAGLVGDVKTAAKTISYTCWVLGKRTLHQFFPKKRIHVSTSNSTDSRSLKIKKIIFQSSNGYVAENQHVPWRGTMLRGNVHFTRKFHR